MENFEEAPELPDNEVNSNLVITEDIRSYLYETSKWAKFLSIIGFIGSGFLVLISFSVGAIISATSAIMGPTNPYAAMGSGVLTVTMLLTALLYFYPSFLLFKFSNATRKAVLYEDQHSLSVSAAKMKSFFKFWGILTIIVLAFYILFFLIMMVAGIGAASMAS